MNRIQPDRQIKIKLYPVVMKIGPFARDEKGSKRVQILRKAARQSARVSAQLSGFGSVKFDKDNSGIPVPSKGVYWSISHKPGVVAGVVSDQKIGIDIEEIKPVSGKLIDRILSLKECMLFKDDDESIMFFRAFTAKEAVLKLNGKGIRKLAEVSVIGVENQMNMCLSFQGRKYRVENFLKDNYLASVTKNVQEVIWSEKTAV